MRILLAGGGTAGHINPAIAIADTIKRHEPESEIAFIGTKNGLENDLVAKAGYPIYHIEMSGLSRSLSPKNIKTAYLYLTAPKKAKKLIKEFRPDVVLGTGGYLSWPLLKAASALGVPSAVHESNAIPGKAVKMLENKVNRIYLNFPDAAKSLKNSSKIMVVGNPLIGDADVERSEMLQKKLGVPDGVKCTVLSFGGSLGAEKLTESLIGAAKNISAARSDVYFIHSAGNKKYDDAMTFAKSVGVDKNARVNIQKYIYNMPEWEACADIVICRAGAMTISEMAQKGKAAIIVPSPYVVNNHQYENAKRLADAGAAIMIEEKDLSARRLEDELTRLIENPEYRRSFCEKIRAFSYPQAKERIYRDLCELAETGRGRV